MSAELIKLASSEKGWVAQRATLALEIKQQFDTNEITESEFKELMEDLIRSDSLNEEADDIELKNLLVSSIMIASQVI